MQNLKKQALTDINLKLIMTYYTQDLHNWLKMSRSPNGKATTF